MGYLPSILTGKKECTPWSVIFTCYTTCSWMRFVQRMKPRENFAHIVRRLTMTIAPASLIDLNKTMTDLFASVDPYAVIHKYQHLWSGRGDDYYDRWCYPLTYFAEIACIEQTTPPDPWRLVVGKFQDDCGDWNFDCHVECPPDANRWAVEAFNSIGAIRFPNYKIALTQASVAILDDIEIAAIIYDELGWCL